MSQIKRVMIFAWGSRGDIQPIVSLARRLLDEGREVLVFATPPATDLLVDHGIACVTAQEDIEAFSGHMFGNIDLADRSLRGMVRQVRQARAYFDSPGFLALQQADVETALAAARGFDPDVIVVPNTMYAPMASIAEALGRPVVTMDLQINHPSSDYPTFTWEVDRFPRAFNRSLYRIRTWVFGQLVKSKTRALRDICGLSQDSYVDGSRYRVWPHELPQICCVSPRLCPRPAEWPPQKEIGGWLFTAGRTDYTPPPGLAAFLEHDPVCIGFGSMMGNPEFRRTMSTLVIEALKLAGIKGVLLGGWAGLTREALDMTTDKGRALHAWAEENVYEIDACPHDWLFPQCAAVVHHGGAGTLAAGIRSGRPTVVCSLLLDQPFHGSLVRKRGIGTYMGTVGSRQLTATALAEGIRAATTDPEIARAAALMGAQVRDEDGPGNMVRFIDEMAQSFRYPWPLRTRTSTDADADDDKDAGTGSDATDTGSRETETEAGAMPASRPAAAAAAAPAPVAARIHTRPARVS